MSDSAEGEEIDNGSYLCRTCNTWFPTEGESKASEDDLQNELREHEGDYHD